MSKNRFAMIQMSSMVGQRFVVPIGFYARTKRYNYQFNKMVDEVNKKAGNYTRMNIDSLGVCPSYVSTPMMGHIKKLNASLPIEIARGSLNDLGSLKISSGSDMHINMGCFWVCTPKWVLDVL